MLFRKWLLLALSALLYPLPFIFSHSLWWIVFIFPIPLFYAALLYKLSFKDGYFWGLISFGIHTSGVLDSVMDLAQGDFLYSIIPALLINAYIPLYSGICFLATTKIIKTFKIKNMAAITTVWIVGLWMYFYLIDRYSLWLFDNIEGYFLMHPLLPLAEHTQLLKLLPLMGKTPLSLLLFSFAGLTAMFLVSRKRLLLLCLLAVGMPWIISWYWPEQHQITPEWLSRLAYIQKTFDIPGKLSAMAKEVREEIKFTLEKNPQAELIIIPESSFHTPHLATIPELSAQWDSKHLSRTIDLLIGAFRWDKQKYRNTLYWIHDGKIKTYFDKRHAMLLVERPISLFDFAFIKDLYFSKDPPIIPSENKRPQLDIFKDVSFVPYICSELFFKEYPDDSYDRTPILALSHDLWTDTFYVRNLMYLAAKFKAIQWKRDILYISFSNAAFLDKTGHTILLPAY